MFIVRVLQAGEGGSAFIRDESFATRSAAVHRVRALGVPGPRFLERGMEIRVAFLPSRAGKSATK